eukprot:COSAG04_NODE_18926_length_429_cov_0.778788_1_plen_94_part_10
MLDYQKFSKETKMLGGPTPKPRAAREAKSTSLVWLQTKCVHHTTTLPSRLSTLAHQPYTYPHHAAPSGFVPPWCHNALTPERLPPLPRDVSHSE